MGLFKNWKARREKKELDSNAPDFAITDEGLRLLNYLSDPEAGKSYTIEAFEDTINELMNQTGHSRELVIEILKYMLDHLPNQD